MMLCDVAGGPPARGPAMSEPASPVIEATARTALKDYLRIEDGRDDDLLDRLLASAIGHGEALTGRLFLIRSVVETASALPVWRRLRWGPVRTIGAPQSLAADGTASPLAVGGYAVDIDGAGDGWMLIRPGAVPDARTRVTYQAGLAAGWAALPEPLGQGALRLAAHFYTYRDSVEEAALPAAVAALWRPWRRMRLA